MSTVIVDTRETEEQVAKQKTPLGGAQIGELYGVDKDTVSRWLYRSRLGRMDPRFPEPDGHLSPTAPWWWDTTVTAWAKASGRKTVAEKAAERAAAGAAGEAPDTADDVVVREEVTA